MSRNDVMILDSILEQRKIPELSSEENFELFAYDQILKDYNLSDEELSNGKVGGKSGIAIFNFINDDLIDEDTDLDEVKRENKRLSMTTFLILAKPSYSGIYMDSIAKIIRDIFDFNNDKSDAKSFKNVYLKLVPHDTLINIVFASREGTTSSTMLQNIEVLKKMIALYMKGVNIISRLVGPDELIVMAHKERGYSLKLKYEDMVSDGDAYFILSTISDYEDFVTDEEGNLRRYIFDSNVRDYQRNSGINKGIESTLRAKGRADFWWLNNGITILAKNPTMARNIINLEDVQIVNGLQTTYIVHKYLKDVKEKDKRKLGIKVVTTDDPEIRDAIIKAASSQNPIEKAALRANDSIQRNIESYLLSNDWFYDRRKNYYKNMRKPVSKIISITYLAQAITSIIYREPNRARRSPTSLTKDDKDYSLLFEFSNYKIFLFCIRNMKKIDSYMRSCDYDERYKTNLKWHLATFTMIRLLGKKDYTIKDIESILDVNIETRLIDRTMSDLIKLTDMYLASHNVTFRTLSGNKEFVNYILERIGIGESGNKNVIGESGNKNIIGDSGDKNIIGESGNKSVTAVSNTNKLRTDLLGAKNA